MSETSPNLEDVESRLIFLVSQPRSGSTLLQHMLASHPEVGTLPESWLMLPLVSTYTSHLVQAASYEAEYAQINLREFTETLGDDGALLRRQMRETALRYFDLAMEKTGRRFYLEKTPRYYHILPELAAMFPAARFILLRRNPLAVMASIRDTNMGGNWFKLFRRQDRRADLLDGPRLMEAALRQPPPRCFTLRYEDLVEQPEALAKDMCRTLDLEFSPDMLAYGDKVRFADSRGVDPKSIYQHDRPVTQYRDTWLKKIRNQQDREIFLNYLEELGPDTLRALGYDFKELRDEILRQPVARRFPVAPWRYLRVPAHELPLHQQFLLRLCINWHRDGWYKGIRRSFFPKRKKK